MTLRHIFIAALPLAVVGLVACRNPSSENIERDSSGLATSSECEARDTACIAETRDLSRHIPAMTKALGVDVLCKVSTPYRISKPSGAYYYSSAVRCVPSESPTPERAAAFDAAMEAEGFHGWTFSSGVVLGWNATTACRTPPTQDERCVADVKDPTRFEGVIWAAMGVRYSCEVGAPARVSAGADYYYKADVVCRPEWAVDPRELAAFDARMEAMGWHGYSVDAAATVKTTDTTRRCSSY